MKAWETVLDITEEKVNELKGIIREMLQANVIGVKPLRSLAETASNVATVIYMWRPFLSQLWAAFASADEPVSSKFANCVWG